MVFDPSRVVVVVSPSTEGVVGILGVLLIGSLAFDVALLDRADDAFVAAMRELDFCLERRVTGMVKRTATAVVTST